jgi:hypothetical protein
VLEQLAHVLRFAVAQVASAQLKSREARQDMRRAHFHLGKQRELSCWQATQNHIAEAQSRQSTETGNDPNPPRTLAAGEPGPQARVNDTSRSSVAALSMSAKRWLNFAPRSHDRPSRCKVIRDGAQRWSRVRMDQKDSVDSL